MTRYELFDRIGVGGMAEIFRGKAIAAGGFEKPVAIKRILPHLSQDKRFVELLIAEAKVLSLLKHRNIVQIFDVGLGDDGQYFLVMEFVDGKDLGAIQRAEQRLPFDLALHIGAEVCEALEHAHAAKAPDGRAMSLVHRDVSPSNVLLSRAGEVKLTDFGIAKRAEAEQTRGGAVRGKFAYISPEQARNEHVEPRSDVFSVGILLWEMVTGRPLFSALGDLEQLRAVREANIAPPSSIVRSVGSDFDALLMSALARDIKRRPTAGQLGERLRAIRYSLESTGGDPATELARIIDAVEDRESSQSLTGFVQTKRPPQGTSGFEDLSSSIGIGEATVIRIRTAEEFEMLDKNPNSISDAKRVIDRFEDEETRLAQLTGDQLRLLRSSRSARDSEELAPPPSRSRRETDEPTAARPPLDELLLAMRESPMPHESYDGDEATRLVAPTSRRTPPPERVRPLPGVPPRVPPATASAPTQRAQAPAATASAPTQRAPQPSQRTQPARGRPITSSPPDMPIGAGPPAMPVDASSFTEEASRSWVPGTVHERNPSPESMRIGPAKQQPLPELEDSVPTPVTIAKQPPTQPRRDPRRASSEAPSVHSHSMPSHSAPSHSMPSQPSHSMPSHSMPSQPSHSMPSHSAPSHSMPSQPSHSMPSHSALSHSTPSHSAPSHAMPSHSTPSHAMPSHSPPTPLPMQQQPMQQQPMQQQPMQPMQQQPMQQQPMQQPMQQQPRPSYPQQPAPMWPPHQQAPRTSQPDLYAQQPRASQPSYRKPAPRPLLQPWMLVVGALVMAALAFLVTRVLIAK